MSLASIKMIYYSILKYGIFFWGNGPLSMSIFKIQKRIIRVMSHDEDVNSKIEYPIYVWKP
jgi:hypothetical protein